MERIVECSNCGRKFKIETNSPEPVIAVCPECSKQESIGYGSGASQGTGTVASQGTGTVYLEVDENHPQKVSHLPSVDDRDLIKLD